MGNYIFNVKCLYCHSIIEASEEYLGQRVECPNCKNEITINFQSNSGSSLLKNQQPDISTSETSGCLIIIGFISLIILFNSIFCTSPPSSNNSDSKPRDLTAEEVAKLVAYKIRNAIPSTVRFYEEGDYVYVSWQEELGGKVYSKKYYLSLEEKRRFAEKHMK